MPFAKDNKDSNIDDMARKLAHQKTDIDLDDEMIETYIKYKYYQNKLAEAIVQQAIK